MTDLGITPFNIDTSQWPLVHISPSAASIRLPVESLDATYPKFEALLARRRPLISLFDARGLKVDAAGRLRFAQWVRDNDNTLRHYLVAHAAIVGSKFERGLFTAMLWLIKPNWPMRAFDDEAKARDWLKAEWEERFDRTR